MKATFTSLFLFFAFLSWGQVPQYKSCEGSIDSTCNAKAHTAFKQELIAKLFSEMGYAFNDSIVFEYEISAAGEPKVLESYYLYSQKGRDLLESYIENSQAFSQSSTGKTFTTAFLVDLPERFRSFKDVDSVKNPIILDNCIDFNQTGKKGCARYLATILEEQLEARKKVTGDITARLYLSGRNLKAIEFTNFPLSKYYNDLIYDLFNRYSKGYIGWEANGTWDDQWITLKLDAFEDSLTRYNYFLEHLDYLARMDREQEFLKVLFGKTDHYQPGSGAYYEGTERADFVMSQLTKIGYDQRSSFRLGSRKYEVDSIRTYRPIDVEEEQDPRLSEKIPVFDGCDEDDDNEERKMCFQRKLMQFVGKNFEFPDEARRAGIQGRVYVNFVIEKDGGIRNIEVVRSAHPLLDFESIRVVSLIPDMEAPAMQEGEPVRMSFTLPIGARLQ